MLVLNNTCKATYTDLKSKQQGSDRQCKLTFLNFKFELNFLMAVNQKSSKIRGQSRNRTTLAPGGILIWWAYERDYELELDKIDFF